VNGALFEFFKKTLNETITRVKKAFTEKILSEKDFEKIFFEIELGLIQSNVSSKVADKIKEELKNDLVGKSVSKDLKKAITESLKNTLSQILEEIDYNELLKKIKGKKPYTIMVIGVNVQGKQPL
jgi:signal recognition particle GTPase